jgi:multidrug resistance efflux pump
MVSIAKAQVQEVDNQYKYLKIMAPNDGVITKKMIKVGEMAIPGMPALILTDLSDLKITAEVSESDLHKIAENQKVKITIPSINFTTEGYIQSIIPSSNPMTHTFMIKIAFKSNNKVYPGMYAKTIIKGE